MKTLTILSTFSTNESRPVYFAKHVANDGTTVLIGMAGKFRSFADQAARTYHQPLDGGQFEDIRQRALATFRERFAQQKHQPFAGTDDEILRSFGQLIISPNGLVKAFAWGRFRFSSVQNGVGQTDLPTTLSPGQYVIGDVEGAGVTTTVAQNLAKLSGQELLAQAAGSLADPFMLVTVEAATYQPPMPVAEPVPVALPTQAVTPEPVFVEAPIKPTPEPPEVRLPRPPVVVPIEPPMPATPVFPWKAVAIILLSLIILASIGGAIYWRRFYRPVAVVQPANPPASTADSTYQIDPENTIITDEEQAKLDSASVIEEPHDSNESSDLSQAEQLFQQYRNQPDSLMYLVNAAGQVDNMSDQDRKNELRAEIDRERSYRFNEQSQIGRTAYDRAVLYLLADQQAKAGTALRTAQHAYELALLLQPDKADAVKPLLDQVLTKLNPVNEN